MATTDYDAPRTRDEDEPASESLEATRARTGATSQAPGIGLEDADTAEGIDLPGAELSHEELTVAVIPEQVDEFTCGSCFLVRHRSQLARQHRLLHRLRGLNCAEHCLQEHSGPRPIARLDLSPEP